MTLRAPASLAAAALTAALTLAVAPPAEAVQGCDQVDRVNHQCTQKLTVPGSTTPDRGGTPGDEGGSDGPFTGCLWEPVDRTQYLLELRPDDVSDEAVYMMCVPYTDGNRGLCPCEMAWIEPGEAPQVTPEEVARSIDISVLLRSPAVATNPPQGRPAIVGNPVFVSVTNWQGPVSQDGCIGTVCVVVQAEPTLTFDPGDGSDVVLCADGGTSFDPGGDEPAAQAAAPGACAHVYELHSGGDGRPAAWPASVTITWEVTWVGAGQSGVFDPVVQTTPFTVDVDEVHGVVTDG